MSSDLARLQATASTAQCQNSFFRLENLKAVHDILRTNVTTLKEAIIKDTKVSDAEAVVEIAQTLSIIKQHYRSIKVTEGIEEEYKVANGKDAPSRRVPWGVVFIEPQWRHTPFLSVVSTVSAALVAGNCVALKFENTTRALPSILRDLLPQALIPDVFAPISSTPSSEDLEFCLQVIQASNNISSPNVRQLVSHDGVVVAFVDRTANLALAAESLVTARFAFGGTSPYAPDLVLVNEYVEKEFLDLVLSRAIRYLTRSSSKTNGTVNGSGRKLEQKSPIEATITSLQSSPGWHTDIVTQGEHGAVVSLVSTTTHPTLPPKTSSPVFAVSTVTSIDHAIDLTLSSADRESDSILAAYHFASAAHAKYLIQFLPAEVSFANHIPNALLLGPAAPSFHTFSLSPRYTSSHFTRPVAAFVAVPSASEDRLLIDSLTGQSAGSVSLSSLKEATTEIQEKKRPEWIAHGFFEQGISIGLGLVGVPILTCLGAGIFWGVRAGWRHWSSR
ncbi:ALDH-like protein [Amniculicola lignicola CBS 123094]|uniref:ALDH-like protein n=1 Tax=Amniculicola lignicola CBS 123094 TaxID=1392246 RepID=A0A6A5WNH8_9PLEO|nr:ALDH-like protein [Amniculicola lignicola CBS 123094]